jgi:hypothetical protein
MTNFRFHNEQTANGVRKIVWASIFRGILQAAHGTNEEWQLPLVTFKWKMETAKFCLIAENGNGKGKFVFLGWQMITVIDESCSSKRAHLCSCLVFDQE